MSDKFFNQRQSAPTGAQESEFKQRADRLLGDASCWLLFIWLGIAALLAAASIMNSVGNLRIVARLQRAEATQTTLQAQQEQILQLLSKTPESSSNAASPEPPTDQ